jgi:hypothetical protein
MKAERCFIGGVSYWFTLRRFWSSDARRPPNPWHDESSLVIRICWSINLVISQCWPINVYISQFWLLYVCISVWWLVEGNSRFCKVALGIPNIPGNSHGFPGIPGSFGNPSLSQELKRGLPQAGNWGPQLHFSPRHQLRMRSMAIQKGKTHSPIIFLPAPNGRF